VARLAPRQDRDEWVEEWLGELAALKRAGATTPRRASFALGALPHAISLRASPVRSLGLGSDLRLALRTLVRRPGFSGVAALTLALGIAANAALFSMVDGLLLQPPPGLAEPTGLVQLGRSYDDAPRWDNFSWPVAEHIRQADHLFEGVATYSGRTVLLGEGTEAELVPGVYVSGEFFDVLGILPHLGRLLQAADDREGAPATVVLSHRLWERRYGSDASIVGRALRIGGTPYEVVGVAAANFAGVDKLSPAPDVYLATSTFSRPIAGGLTPRTDWGMSWLWTIARLRAGLDAEAARAGLDGVTQSLRSAGPDNDGIRVLLEAGLGLTPDERAEANRLSVLMAAVAGLVLLLTCANVAGLFLTRAVDRQAEFALRRTLGAGGGRIARQLLIESVVLAGLATLLATPLLHLGSAHIGTLIPSAVSLDFMPDPRVYVALLVLGITAGLVFGGVPAVVAARGAPGRRIGSSRTSTGTRTTHRVRQGLVVAQVALSLGLLAGAGLLLRSVSAAMSARPGLNPERVLAASLDLALTGRYDDPSTRAAFLDRLTADLAADPAIEDVALSTTAAFFGPFARRSQRPLEAAGDVGFEADAIAVGPAWFDMMGMPIVEGRAFSGDGEAEPVVVVDESLAARFWPNGTAIGQYLATNPASRVIGIVPSARTRSLRRGPAPTVYAPLSQADAGSVTVQVRPRRGVDRADGVAALRRVIAALDPALPVARVADLQDQMASTLGETRNLGMIVAVVSGLALLLATLGLYASVAYTVARGTRELAVRIAIGARPEAVFTSVVRRGLGQVALGVTAGVGVAWLLGRALEGTLYTVGSFDPTTLGGVALLQVVVAMAATVIPALRATRLDPCVALRQEGG
jgi:predicted permease